MKKITPFLWFDDKAEEAANFYISLFKNSKIEEVSRYGKGASYPEGTAFIVNFVLDGQALMAINAGPEFPFTEAISFYVDCENQEEVDRLWEKLTDGGEEVQCGWLKDRYGLVWQIIPSALPELLNDKDVDKAERVRKAMLKMKKIDIEELRKA
jgi:predicted 3-demethylubiquinone-9 3-methyltransferase (glyoxalase superfamily)